jgi:methionyl aminopeptidase
MVDGWHGHGVGRSVHEAPQAPSNVSAGLREFRDFTLLPGMVLAIEPIVVMGAQGVIDDSGCLIPVPVSVAADRWTVAVAPGLVAAHVEHTIAVTRSGPRILTRRTGVRAGIALNDCNGGSSRLLG